MGNTVTKICAALVATAAFHAQAIQIINLSRQGEVARVRQVGA